jgi:hypothetical protein
MDDDLMYWRTLAEERGRQLTRLRGRLLVAIDSIPEAHVRPLISALDPSWLSDLDSMTVSTELESSDVTTVLDEVWRRSAAHSSS